MPSPRKKDCLGTTLPELKKFLKRHGCQLVEWEHIEATIRSVALERGENWPWISKVSAESQSVWVNNGETVVFAVPLESLAGRASLEFAQEMWMLQPSVFEFQVWGDRGFVRMWWDPSRSAFPGHGTW
jgi:hypothetical protein